MNIEHQTDPQVFPGTDWTEVDHASDNVAYDPEIQAPVLELFDLIVDPTDEWNKWLIPKPDLATLFDEIPICIDEFSYRHHFRLSNGCEGWLVYEDASISGQVWRSNVNRVVRVELGNQLTLPINLLMAA